MAEVPLRAGPAPARARREGALPPAPNGLAARWTCGDVTYQLDRAGVLSRRAPGGPPEPLAAQVTLELALAAFGPRDPATSP